VKILKVISVATIAALTFACGADNDEGSTSELDGTWVGTCSADDDTFSKMTQMFSSGQVTGTFNDYSDASCATETLAIVISRPFSTGAAVTTPADAKESTFSPTTKVTVTLKTDELVSAFNGTAGNSATCGGGFVKNQTKEVTAANCGGVDGLFDTTTVYSIYKIDGTKLYIGDCGDGGTATDCTSATKRPTTLDTNFLTKS
jgi:hypothetical protein